MNGKTVVASSAPPALPDDGDRGAGPQRPQDVRQRRPRRRCPPPPPSAPTPAAGRSPRSPRRGPGSRPRRGRGGASARPACRSPPRPRGRASARIATAVLPTPPLAPVTSTGPSPGRSPWSSSAATLIAAVKPAVPIAIASRAVSPSGSGTTQPAGHPRELAEAAVARDAEVVAVGEHRVADRDRRSVGRDDLAGEVDAGDQRVDPGDLAVGDRAPARPCS